MSEVKMFSEPVPNVPWQDRPANDNHDAPIWRYTENPIIGRNPAKGVARIFNSAVVPFDGKFVGVFRGEQVNGIPYIYLGESEDAIHWNISEEKIKFVDENGEEFMPIYAYDPRLVKVEDTYYAIWCQDFYGAAIGIAKSKDLKTFVRIENPFLPFNRNAVLFPRKINGNFVMLSRPSDSGHTPFGDIFVSESPDMVYWGKHRHVMGKSSEWWESLKIGGGAAPIETSEGWLLFYHGVAGTSQSYGLNYQKLGRELMSQDRLALMDGGKCILQVRGVRPFFSDKVDITAHEMYKELSDFDKKNQFDIEKYVSEYGRPKFSKKDKFIELDLTGVKYPDDLVNFAIEEAGMMKKAELNEAAVLQ